MPRPLMQQRINQLEDLFAKSKGNLKVLRQLKHELQFRQVPRAVALLELVQSEIKVVGSAETPDATPVLEKQPELWPQPPAVKISEPPLVQQPAAQSKKLESPPGIEAAPTAAPFMTVDEACRVLNVSTTSPWHEVEQIRRQLVLMSNPARVRSLSAERKNQLRSEAQRVNSAYLVLSAGR